MNYTIREAISADIPAILPLLPRLADFELPPRRNPTDLWAGDADLLRQWGRGEAPHCLVLVAVDEQAGLLGAALVSLRAELLSHEPSAQLEVLVIDPGADGNGVGQALLTAIETAVYERGAQSMSLHVFANNRRARHVYERQGYSGELLRYIKHFE